MRNLIIFLFLLSVSVFYGCSKTSPNSPAGPMAQITFKNNTLTIMYLNFSDTSFNLISLDSATVAVSPNKTFAYNGRTYGSLGGAILDFVDSSLVAPAAGNRSVINLDAPATYFCLILNNSSSLNINSLTYYSPEGHGGFVYIGGLPSDSVNHGTIYLTSDVFSLVITSQLIPNSSNAYIWQYGDPNGGSPVPPNLALPVIADTTNQSMVIKVTDGNGTVYTP